ncbi:hypothetical protein AWENTII_003021 [Aspergillus wentii]|nr:hypothetical protein MW887_007223 [Aspergillus wentii]
MEMMRHLDTFKTLHSFLLVFPDQTDLFTAYFQTFIQSISECFFQPDQRRLFYTILSAHFLHPLEDHLRFFMAEYFRLPEIPHSLTLPPCVPRSLAALDYMASLQLSLQYFSPCAEDIISRNEPCQTDLTQEMLQSRHLLLHLQFKEELFSRLPECQLPSAIKRFRSYYTLHQSYHETKLTGVLVHWMRQKLGLDGEPVEERYIRVVDIEPSSGEYAGLPLLHRLAGGGICSEDGIRYIQHFTRVNKSSMGVRGSDKLRIPGPWSKK